MKLKEIVLFVFLIYAVAFMIAREAPEPVKADVLTNVDMRNHAGTILTWVDLDSAGVDTVWFPFQTLGTATPFINNYRGALTAVVRVDTGTGVTYAQARDSLGVSWHLLQHDPALGRVIPISEANLANYLWPTSAFGDTGEVTAADFNWGTGHADTKYSASSKINPRPCDGIGFILRNGPGASACRVRILIKEGAPGPLR